MADVKKLEYVDVKLRECFLELERENLIPAATLTDFIAEWDSLLADLKLAYEGKTAS